MNGTLEGAELEQVERHVAECVRCRRELSSLRVLQAAVVSDERDPALADALARLRVRLDGLEGGRRRRFWHALSQGWRESRPWVRVFVAVQAVLLMGLAGLLLTAQTGPVLYRTLGDVSPHAQGDGVVVVFRGESSVGHVNSVLLRIKARVVAGPNTAGAYTLQVPAGERAAALALLRGDAMVVFAEPTPGRP
jgi:anti-sigma factor RsiW